MKIVLGLGAYDAAQLQSFFDIPEGVELILLKPDGTAWARSGDEVEVVSFDGAQDALMECCQQIKKAWEDQMPAETQHLGHAAVGMWLFYWPTEERRLTWELVRQGRVD